MFKKSQLKHIARLHCASVLDATDIYVFEESKNLLTEEEQYFILLEIKKISQKLAGKDNIFNHTKDIIEYVKLKEKC